LEHVLEHLVLLLDLKLVVVFLLAAQDFVGLLLEVIVTRERLGGFYFPLFVAHVVRAR